MGPSAPTGGISFTNTLILGLGLERLLLRTPWGLLDEMEGVGEERKSDLGVMEWNEVKEG